MQHDNCGNGWQPTFLNQEIIGDKFGTFVDGKGYCKSCSTLQYGSKVAGRWIDLISFPTSITADQKRLPQTSC